MCHQEGILIFILTQYKRSLIVLELNSLIRKFLKKKISKPIKLYIQHSREQFGSQFHVSMFCSFCLRLDIFMQYNNVRGCYLKARLGHSAFSWVVISSAVITDSWGRGSLSFGGVRPVQLIAA